MGYCPDEVHKEEEGVQVKVQVEEEEIGETLTSPINETYSNKLFLKKKKNYFHELHQILDVSHHEPLEEEWCHLRYG